MGTSSEISRIRDKRRSSWQRKWAQDDFFPPWQDRGVAQEIIAAVREGWLPGEGKVLDLGCGSGDVAAWFAEQGYPSLGVDIAEAAVGKARAKHDGRGLPLRFEAVDLCDARALPQGKYDILIDRGCLHGIPGPLLPDYIANIVALSAPDAKMLLFMRAFRGRRWLLPALFDFLEERYHVYKTRKMFDGAYKIVAHARTSLGRPGEPGAEKRMGGLVFYMVKT